MASQALSSGLEQAPLGGPGYMLRILSVLLGRNARLWLRFRVSMVMDLLGGAAQASVFFFLGTTLVASGQQAWQTNYTAFLAIGIVFNSVMSASLSGPYQALSMDYWMQRLETILLSPCPVGLSVLSQVGWSYARTLLNVLILAAVGWAFGAHVQTTGVNGLLTLLALLLAAVAVLGFGLMSAAMFMLINAKGWNDPISWIVGILQGLVTGVYFPITLLPGWLHALAMLLPQTYAIDAARRLLLANAGSPPLLEIGSLSAVQADPIALACAALILPALGAALFAAGLAKARNDGGLSRWT